MEVNLHLIINKEERNRCNARKESAASELQKSISMKKIFQSLGAILVDRNGNVLTPLIIQ